MSNNTNNVNENEAQKQETKKTEKKDVTYIVSAPVEDFCGIVAGVHFAYGKAEVKPGWILDWFKERGYKVEEKK